MSQQAIGKILLMPKGDYSGATTYNQLDWVRYGGKAWVCKVDGTVNVTPVQGANWQLLAQDGSGGGGGASDWDDINYKPFDTIDTTTDFTVDNLDNNKLHIKRDTFGTVRVVSGGTTTNLEASGDSTIEIDAGTNVTITADDSSNPKKITINSSGGGGGAGSLNDLSDVTITGTPNNGEILQYNSSASAFKNVAMPTIPDELSDLTGDVSISTPSDGQVLAYDSANSKWKNQNPSGGGHTMVDNTPLNDLIDEIASATTSNNKVVSAYGIQKWSNSDVKNILVSVSQGDTGLGVWNDGWKEESPAVRTGWMWHSELYQVLEDGNGNKVTDIRVDPVFVPADDEVVSCYAMRIDDDYTLNGVHGGCVAFKFNGEISSANGATVGVQLTHLRTEDFTGTKIS